MAYNTKCSTRAGYIHFWKKCVILQKSNVQTFRKYLECVLRSAPKIQVKYSRHVPLGQFWKMKNWQKIDVWKLFWGISFEGESEKLGRRNINSQHFSMEFQSYFSLCLTSHDMSQGKNGRLVDSLPFFQQGGFCVLISSRTTH